MKTVCVCTLLAALIAGGCATVEGESYALAGFDFSGIEKVAILEVSGEVEGEVVKNQIGDLFEMELLKKGYTPVLRGKVQALLKEQEFQASDITSEEGAAAAGKILNVPAVMLISIPKYEEDMSMTVKMIDVEGGAVLWMGTGTGSTGRTLATVLGGAAGAAIGAVAAGGDTVDRVVGGIAGGVLGGVAGYALSPKQEKHVRQVLKTICKGLPSRLPAQE